MLDRGRCRPRAGQQSFRLNRWARPVRRNDLRPWGLTVRPDPCDRGKAQLTASRKTLPMSRPAMQRLSFFLLMGVTLYASLIGAG